MSARYRRNRALMWIMFAALMVLHHDWWFWTDGRLLFGFLPIGLGYHVLISVAAGSLWAWAAFFAWPDHLDQASAAAAADRPSHGH